MFLAIITYLETKQLSLYLWVLQLEGCLYPSLCNQRRLVKGFPTHRYSVRALNSQREQGIPSYSEHEEKPTSYELSSIYYDTFKEKTSLQSISCPYI